MRSPSGRGRERNSNRVADAFLQHYTHRGAGGDYALCSHARFGQAKMQRILAARGQRAINVDQILHAADLRAQNDLVGAQAELLRQVGGIQRAHDHRFHGYFARVFRLVQARILVHHAGEQRLVERSPVHADAHRLLILHRDFDHGAEIGVAGLADAGVAGIDAVLGQIARALGILGQQNMAVVVEVADDGHADALLVELLDDVRDGCGRLVIVHGNAHQFRPGASQRCHLLHGRRDIRRIGVGHRLHHNWCIRPDAHTADDARLRSFCVEYWPYGKLLFYHVKCGSRGYRGCQNLIPVPCAVEASTMAHLCRILLINPVASASSRSAPKVMVLAP